MKEESLLNIKLEDIDQFIDLDLFEEEDDEEFDLIADESTDNSTILTTDTPQSGAEIIDEVASIESSFGTIMPEIEPATIDLNDYDETKDSTQDDDKPESIITVLNKNKEEINRLRNQLDKYQSTDFRDNLLKKEIKLRGLKTPTQVKQAINDHILRNNLLTEKQHNEKLNNYVNLLVRNGEFVKREDFEKLRESFDKKEEILLEQKNAILELKDQNRGLALMNDKYENDLNENMSELKKFEKFKKEYISLLPIFDPNYKKKYSKVTYEESKTEKIFGLTRESLHDIFINAINTNLIKIPIKKTTYVNDNLENVVQYKIKVNNLGTSKIVDLYEYLQDIIVRFYEKAPRSIRKVDVLKNKHSYLTHYPNIRLQLTETEINILFGWFDKKALYEDIEVFDFDTKLPRKLNFYTVESYEIKARIRLWREEYYSRNFPTFFNRNKPEFEGDFIEENESMVYVSIFDENSSVKIGRSENWPHRKSKYYYDSDVKYNMLLAWYMYVPKHEDKEVTKYIMYCLEDKLKELGHKHFELLHGKEYFKSNSFEDSEKFINEVNETLNKMTVQEILKMRDESRIKSFANNNNRNTKETIKILTKLRNGE